MRFAAGSRLGHYEILSPLGAGGMGEVYRARDPKLGRDVALKVLPAEVSADADRLARFAREARTVAGLSHPNIVVLYSMEEADGVHFLTMELVDGEALDRQVGAGGMPVARVVETGIALADALTAAHERGVVHRDLKPANVVVSREGRVKVLDFGLARPAEAMPAAERASAATMASPLSEAGSILGSAPYMAPEQVRGEAVDARTDVFALGIVLYELISGRRPFTGATPADTSSAILRDAPAPLSGLRKELPGELERIVARCLEKNPRERFQTALDVANELRTLRRRLDGGAPRAASPADPRASIAVLPFVNRSASADDEYFSDGLADELLNVLAKIKGLRVIARSSSFRFKGTNEDVATIGATLDVATVLEGSVRKAGPRVRVAVQLVNVADRSHLWSETYDRTLDDIFAVQDDIAQSVVKELRTTLLGEAADSAASGAAKADVARAARGRGTDPEAHRLYLLARHRIDRFTSENTAETIELLHQAVTRDPGFAHAWAELGRAHARQADGGWTSVNEGYDRARRAAERSLELEPDLAEGHALLGWIRMAHDWDFRGAQAAYDRALELAPRNATVLRGAGTLAKARLQLEVSIELLHRALEQDPLGTSSYNNLSSTLYAMGRLTEAEAAARKSLELVPQGGLAHANLALILLEQGRIEEALAEARTEPDRGFRQWGLAIVHHAVGRGSESQAAVDELIGSHGQSMAFQIAEVHGARGEVDAAFEWLERAVALRDGGIADTKFSPHLRLLHDDPRWRPFLERLGLAD